MHTSFKAAAFAAVFTVASSAALFSFAAPASASDTLVAHWALDEVNSSTAWDSSGLANNGANYNVVGNGTGYVFNGVDSRVIVNSSPSLNPGASDFSFGTSIVMTAPPLPVGETYDVMRKGLVTTAGGDYKFEVKNVNGKALARCVAKTVKPGGVKVLAAIQGTTNLADGKEHQVTCSKTSTTITLKVDSLALRVKTFTGGLGTVSNTSNLALGAKAETTANTGFDWYEGIINDAWVSIG